MSNAWQDVRYGLRLPGKRPGSTEIAIIASALGIGADALMFSVADGMLLRPVDLLDTDRLTVITEVAPQQTMGNGGVSPANSMV